MEALETAFERCVGVLGASSKDDDVAVEVIILTLIDNKCPYLSINWLIWKVFHVIFSSLFVFLVVCCYCCLT